MVARSSYRIYPRGFDTSSVLRGAFVQRERRDRAWPDLGGFPRGWIGGFDLKMLLIEMHDLFAR